MANSLQLSASLSYTGNNVSISIQVSPAITASVAGAGLVSLATVTVPTTAAAIPVAALTGGVASGGWLFVRNLDPTNYMGIETATSGTYFAKLLPGEFCFLRLDPGLTAPFWKANTATVQAELAIFDL